MAPSRSVFPHDSVWPGRWRWPVAFSVALLLHTLLLIALVTMNWRAQPDTAEHAVRVVLKPAVAPEPEPVLIEPPPPAADPPPPDPATPAVESAPPVAVAEPPATPEPEIEVTEPAAAPAPSQVASFQLLAHISKYRLHDERLLEDLPSEPVAPRPLGHINQQDLLAMLDKPLPRLPFADPDTPFVFYSTGFEGAVEKFFDKITRRSSHTTRWGTKIECAYTLVIVVCGFG